MAVSERMPSRRAINGWYPNADRALKRRLTSSTCDFLSEHSSLPRSAYPLVRRLMRLTEIEIPSVERELDAAVRRRRATAARRCRRVLAVSTRAVRSMRSELQAE